MTLSTARAKKRKRNEKKWKEGKCSMEKEGKEKGYGKNWVVKIRGMLRRLQADTHKVKITFKSHVLFVLFLFIGFSLFTKPCTFKCKKHEIHKSTASQYDRM